MLEKRRYPRLNVNLPVILRHRGRLLPATMLNVSCGGMQLRAESAEVVQDGAVEVIFDLEKDQKDLSVRGRIVHVEAGAETADVGVQFTNLFSMSYKTIQEYLRKNLN